MKRVATFGACLALLGPFAGVSAQMSPGARSVGMGGGGMVFASGVDAVEWNPANLGWAGGWNVSLFEFGVASLSSGADLDEVLAIFGADALGSGGLNVSQVINNLPAEGLRISGVTEGFATALGTEAADIPQPGSPFPSIGIAVGPIGIRVRSRVLTDFTLSKELADLIGNGFVEQNIQAYAVGNTGWSTTSFSEVTVAYGTTLGGLLSVGIGGRYVKGHGMVQGRFFEPVTDINAPAGLPKLTLESAAVEATSGTGYGLDIGLSMDLPGGFRAAASGTNLLQRMTWDKNLVAHTATFVDQDFDQDFIDLLNRFEAEPLDPNSVSLAVFEASQWLFEESYFPQVVRAGIGWQAGGTSLEAVGIKVAPRGRFTSAWDERISLGIEQKIPILTLRAGLARAADGLSVVTGGVGLGIGPVQVEASGGKFDGDGEFAKWGGLYGTLAVQLRGGGSR